jgi:hypothetical protein
MREVLHVTVGSKRKRLASGNENALANGRGARSSKRRKTASEMRRGSSFSSTSEDSQSEDEMEVDNSTTISTQSGDSNENDEQEIEEVDEEDVDSCELYDLNAYLFFYWIVCILQQMNSSSTKQLPKGYISC